MKYISTRGESKPLNFDDIVCAGLAPDKGLYVPQSIPFFSLEEIRKMKTLSYQELAVKIIQPFTEGSIPADDLEKIINKSYASFTNDQIAPLAKLDKNLYLLELFHGPTLAFKDFALQVLGNLIEYILNKKNKNVTIIGATSGDTGSAAIMGCKNAGNIKLFILHPHNRISDVQRKQMTTVIKDNVFNLAVESHFDFCQDTVKTLFNDTDFLEGKTNLIAINSINWCRIMAQIVYYFFAALKLGGPEKQISFSVPTGNFGDIFAGYIAHKMGLPINQLIIATNKNDILDRFIKNNEYKRGTLSKTISPSMDIQVASNFERLLYYVHDCKGSIVKKLMEDFDKGSISLAKDKFEEIISLFSSLSVSDEETSNSIKSIFTKNSLTIDPHTATGIEAALKCNNDQDIPMVVLATAHPAKFPDAITNSGINPAPNPISLEKIMDMPEEYTVIKDNIDDIKKFIATNI